MYDLKNDPNELEDIIRSKSKIVAKLKGELDKYLENEALKDH
jgi:hypothetical protein